MEKGSIIGQSVLLKLSEKVKKNFGGSPWERAQMNLSDLLKFDEEDFLSERVNYLDKNMKLEERRRQILEEKDIQRGLMEKELEEIRAMLQAEEEERLRLERELEESEQAKMEEELRLKLLAEEEEEREKEEREKLIEKMAKYSGLEVREGLVDLLEELKEGEPMDAEVAGEFVEVSLDNLEDEILFESLVARDETQEYKDDKSHDLREFIEKKEIKHEDLDEKLFKEAFHREEKKKLLDDEKSFEYEPDETEVTGEAKSEKSKKGSAKAEKKSKSRSPRVSRKGKTEVKTTDQEKMQLEKDIVQEDKQKKEEPQKEIPELPEAKLIKQKAKIKESAIADHTTKVSADETESRKTDYKVDDEKVIKKKEKLPTQLEIEQKKVPKPEKKELRSPEPRKLAPATPPHKLPPASRGTGLDESDRGKIEKPKDQVTPVTKDEIPLKTKITPPHKVPPKLPQVPQFKDLGTAESDETDRGKIEKTKEYEPEALLKEITEVGIPEEKLEEQRPRKIRETEEKVREFEPSADTRVETEDDDKKDREKLEKLKESERRAESHVHKFHAHAHDHVHDYEPLKMEDIAGSKEKAPVEEMKKRVVEDKEIPPKFEKGLERIDDVPSLKPEAKRLRKRLPFIHETDLDKKFVPKDLSGDFITPVKGDDLKIGKKVVKPLAGLIYRPGKEFIAETEKDEKRLPVMETVDMISKEIFTRPRPKRYGIFDKSSAPKKRYKIGSGYGAQYLIDPLTGKPLRFISWDEREKQFTDVHYPRGWAHISTKIPQLPFAEPKESSEISEEKPPYCEKEFETVHEPLTFDFGPRGQFTWGEEPSKLAGVVPLHIQELMYKMSTLLGPNADLGFLFPFMIIRNGELFYKFYGDKTMEENYSLN